MGLILRNWMLHKIQLLATKLAKAVTVRPKLFHVEQFGFPQGPVNLAHRQASEGEFRQSCERGGRAHRGVSNIP